MKYVTILIYSDSPVFDSTGIDLKSPKKVKNITRFIRVYEVGNSVLHQSGLQTPLAIVRSETQFYNNRVYRLHQRLGGRKPQV